ncbi:hybrid signal transduction histidine kinase M [Tanacetum coccineum]
MTIRTLGPDNELRSIKIGKMMVNEYCTKIQAMANRLKNLDCEVSKKNMVIFAVNGLDSRFATLAEIIHHREPLPTFETVRNMLLLKESLFNDDSTSTTFESSSSSPTILMASSSSNTKGTCKFRDRCKFIHDHRNRAGLNAKNNTQRATVSGQNNWGSGFGTSPNSQAHRLAHTRSMSYQPQALVSLVYYTASGPGTLAQPVQHTQPQPTVLAHQPAVYMAHQQVLPGQPMSQSNSNGILGASPVLYASQPTSLPSPFSTMSFSSDLYPVTKSSNLHVAFVSISSSTWHQRLGYPGDEVLRSLTSRHFISCNKEKSSHVCHACQLGKHVKLPFHSSDSIVTKCFDIIHSDLWTSPICMSTRSTSNDLVSPLSDPESIIRYRRRNLGDPSFPVDLEEIDMDPNNVQGPPPVGPIHKK